ncbi:MAG: hypothetical protein R2771_11295 [Saprospiraceae bacterium]
MSDSKKILIYGFGNPGRKDDGLGYQFVEHFSKWTSENSINNVQFDCNYQLNIEDAELISTKDIVLFVDASVEDIEEFSISKIDGSSDLAFTTHEASPGYIYYLCEKLFKKTPSAYLLHIKGYNWNFEEGISDKATKNLQKSIEYIKSIFLDGNDIELNFSSAINKNL